MKGRLVGLFPLYTGFIPFVMGLKCCMQAGFSKNTSTAYPSETKKAGTFLNLPSFVMRMKEILIG